MSFRARGQRDDRRRRVANDSNDAATASSSVQESANSTTPVPRYTDAALRENQPHITDLIPLRMITCFGWFSLLMLFAVGIHTLNYFSASWFSEKDAQVFQLASTGTLATWFNSILLTLTASTMLVVYLIRKHKVDDYKGRYRIWLAAAFFCIVISLCEVTEIHHLIPQQMTQLVEFDTTLNGLLPQGALWWLGPAALVGGYISLRVLFDVCESKLSTFSCTSAMGLLMLSTMVDFQWIPELVSPEHQVMFVSGLYMGSLLMLFMTCLVHARFALLDAHGLIEVKTKVKKQKVKKSKNSKKADKKESNTATQQPATISMKNHQSSALANKRETLPPISKKQQKVVDQFDEEIAELQAKEELSKAERRRLKKLLRRQIAA